MKYLLSPLQLGMLIQENNKDKRREMITDWMNLYYILTPNDDLNLNEHIEINKLYRKKKK